jgi:hypothetical protein
MGENFAAGGLGEGSKGAPEDLTSANCFRIPCIADPVALLPFPDNMGVIRTDHAFLPVTELVFTRAIVHAAYIRDAEVVPVLVLTLRAGYAFCRGEDLLLMEQPIA